MDQENTLTLLESVLETFTVLDADGTVRYQSPWFERILGYPPGGMTGKNAFAYVHPDDRAKATAAFATVVRTPGSVVSAEFRFQHHDGSWQFLQAAGKSLQDSSGAVRVVISARNITERKRVEEVVRESEERYRRLVELSPEPIAVHCQGKLVYINAAGARLLGATSPAELLGRPVLDFVHPDYRTIVKARIRQVQEEGTPADVIEEKFIRLDGQVIDVEVAAISTVYQGQAAVQVVVRDITERKRAEQALRESEEQYRDMVESINDVIYTQDEHGVMTYISPVVTSGLSGYRPEEIIGHSFTEFIHPEDLPPLLDSFQRTLTGQLEPSEFRIVAKSGAIRWARSSSRPIHKGGRVVGLRGVITDITERKQAEKRTVALLELAKDISGTLDLHELLDHGQRRTAEVLPCDIVATFYWDSSREVFRMISQYGIPTALLPEAEALAFPPGEPFAGQVASGQTVVINDITAQPWLPSALFAHFRVTALMVVPLQVRGRHLGALVACSTSSGFGFDANQVELCNGIARQLAVGIEATELYRQQQEEAAIASALARVGQELIASLDTPTMLERLCRLTTEILECDCSYTVLWQPTEDAYRVVAGYGNTPEQWELLRTLRVPHTVVAGLVSRLENEDVVELDITDSQQLVSESLLRRFDQTMTLCLALRQGKELIGAQAASYRRNRGASARQKRIAQGIAQTASLALANARLLEELERANRLKQDFVGTMSHELRTPLNVILGYNELLREEAFGALTAEQSDIMERIHKSATQLLDLINATLDLSRLQSQQLPLSLAEVCVADLLTELESETRQLHRKPAVRLEWQVDPLLPPLWTDPVKLRMVLKNLLTNALKFTDEGVVAIAARPQGEGVEFLVRDTGIGIAPETHTLIFEPFRQVDSSTTRRHGGVGLGLYIVRQLLELLGGTVSIDSELGKGATFRVWIPRK